MTEADRVSRRTRPRKRVTVVGVLGEIPITAAVLVLLFLGWQVWLNDIIVGQQLRGESVEQSQEWEKEQGTPDHGTPDDPPVMTAPANAERFALLAVPRFGADYYRPIAEGVGTNDVLNRGNIGHYPTTQMPGAVGNFAIAAHRSAHGGNFHNLHELRVGDHLYVETADGWYSYVFRNLEYVRPTGVGVLNPTPQAEGIEATDRVITLTTCNPFFSTAERLIAYGVFDRWYPRADGPPEEIAATVAGGAG